MLGILRFAGNWKHQDVPLDPMTVKSSVGWVISYAGCPISWALKLQTITITTLSMTEAQYIALSMSWHDIIPRIIEGSEVHVSDNPPPLQG